MDTQLTALQDRVQALERDNSQIRAQFRLSQRRARIQCGLAFAGLVGAILVSPGNRSAIAQGYGVTLASLNTRLMAVEAKTQFQHADAAAKSTSFSGCNLFVNNGTGSTFGTAVNSAGDGLGNLVIGYNLLGKPGGDVRTGSHNLVLGDLNNYSSYGGLIAGSNNSISGPYASVSGGQRNTASGFIASVSGGQGNMASGPLASVSGGLQNTASGDYSSVSGGQQNTASGFIASVSGGASNTARGDASSISGGFSITQSAFGGWSGGSQSGSLISGDFRSP